MSKKKTTVVAKLTPHQDIAVDFKDYCSMMNYNNPNMMDKKKYYYQKYDMFNDPNMRFNYSSIPYTWDIILSMINDPFNNSLSLHNYVMINGEKYIFIFFDIKERSATLLSDSILFKSPIDHRDQFNDCFEMSQLCMFLNTKFRNDIVTYINDNLPIHMHDKYSVYVTMPTIESLYKAPGLSYNDGRAIDGRSVNIKSNRPIPAIVPIPISNPYTLNKRNNQLLNYWLYDREILYTKKGYQSNFKTFNCIGRNNGFKYDIDSAKYNFNTYGVRPIVKIIMQ